MTGLHSAQPIQPALLPRVALLHGFFSFHARTSLGFLSFLRRCFGSCQHAKRTPQRPVPALPAAQRPLAAHSPCVSSCSTSVLISESAPTLTSSLHTLEEISHVNPMLSLPPCCHTNLNSTPTRMGSFPMHLCCQKTSLAIDSNSHTPRWL